MSTVSRNRDRPVTRRHAPPGPSTTRTPRRRCRAWVASRAPSRPGIDAARVLGPWSRRRARRAGAFRTGCHPARGPAAELPSARPGRREDSTQRVPFIDAAWGSHSKACGPTSVASYSRVWVVGPASTSVLASPDGPSMARLWPTARSRLSTVKVIVVPTGTRRQSVSHRRFSATRVCSPPSTRVQSSGAADGASSPQPTRPPTRARTGRTPRMRRRRSTVADRTDRAGGRAPRSVAGPPRRPRRSHPGDGIDR